MLERDRKNPLTIAIITWIVDQKEMAQSFERDFSVVIIIMLWK